MISLNRSVFFSLRSTFTSLRPPLFPCIFFYIHWLITDMFVIIVKEYVKFYVYLNSTYGLNSIFRTSTIFFTLTRFRNHNSPFIIFTNITWRLWILCVLIISLLIFPFYNIPIVQFYIYKYIINIIIHCKSLTIINHNYINYILLY